MEGDCGDFLTMIRPPGPTPSRSPRADVGGQRVSGKYGEVIIWELRAVIDIVRR